MSTIGKRIRERRQQLGLSQGELAKRLGYKSRSSINKIELDQRNLTQSKIRAIADALETSPSYIMGWENQAKNLGPVPQTKKIPLIGTIACGNPILAEENIEEYVNAPKGVNADFCLYCQGDSMINARILDGDIVFIKQQPDVDDGQIAAVLIDNEATLKRVYHNQSGGVTLVSENPVYAPMVFTSDNCNEVRILGKAIAFLSNIH